MSLPSAAHELSTSLDFDLGALELDADESLFLGWLDTESQRASFDVLHGTLFVGGIEFEASFSDASSGDAQLDDLVLPVSLAGVAPTSLHLVLDAHYSGGAGGANTDFALFTSQGVPAPEPTVFALLAAVTAFVLARRVARGPSDTDWCQLRGGGCGAKIPPVNRRVRAQGSKRGNHSLRGESPRPGSPAGVEQVLRLEPVS